MDLACELFGTGLGRRQVESSLRGFAERVGEFRELELEKFLRHQHENRDIRGARAPIYVICDVDDFARWRRRRELAKTSPALVVDAPAAPTRDEILAKRAGAARAHEFFAKPIAVPVFTPKQLIDAARAAAFLEPDPTRRLTEQSKIDCGSTSPEQPAFLEGTLDVAEGGSR